ncbi:leucine-rich repeat-containing protein 24-like [Penaeus japonicus]|uniref:leucine-rich repeat-containing protein 24-like n=1 Tax=Penaeus japonicus TaxID=27405 RepID=UPI001C70E80F|nr:leucine-rich repeat-containing protein 24-like [Penaeus japonicus]
MTSAAARHGTGAALVAVLLTLMLAGGAWASCPQACGCKWKGGKQTVECVNKGLNTIPPGIDPGTQVLDMTGNSLVILSHEKFKVMQLTNLQRIYVSRCKLVQLDDAAFRGLTNLVELDLSHNELTLVPAAALEHVPGLMRLQLSNNPITKIKDGSFRGLKYLSTLEMTSCSIQTLEPRAFQGLDQLEWLKLDDNQLQSVPHKMMLPKSLHGIDLHNNHWKCDCHLIQLRTWLVKYNVPSSIEPKCSSPPRLKAEVIKYVHPDDFACPPEVRPTSFYLDTMEGKNVSFECHVTAEPAARIFWRFNGQSLENSSFAYDESSSFYIFEENGSNDDRVSHLRIEWVTDAHAGVFQCLAENQAGLVISNFTLRISQPIVEPKKEDFVMVHMVYIGVAIVSLVVLVIILLCVLIIRCCRRRSTTHEKVSGSPGVSGNGRPKEGQAPATNNMPKYIQMGTPAPKVNGISSDPPPISVIDSSPYRSEPTGAPAHPNPDLISDAADDRGKPSKKRVSILGVEEVDACGQRTTRKLDDIIEEFEDGYDPTYDQLHPPNDHENHHSNRANPYATIPRRRDPESTNPYPLTEIPPPEEMNQGSRFYDVDGFPVDYGLPRNGNGNGNGQGLSSSYNPMPTDTIPVYATARRARPASAPRPELMHDQKYPEEYRLHSHDPHYHPPDGRYPQAYGLVPEKFSDPTGGSCEFCPPPPVHPDFTTEPGGRIGGDGCSFDNLLSSCGGGSQCCYAEQSGRLYDNSLPENYRPLDPEPPPPEGWGDQDQETVNLSTWCEHPESPGTRVLYSPDETYPDQQPPQGTQV